MHYNFGLGEGSLDHRRREEVPAVFLYYIGKLLRSLKMSSGGGDVNVLDMENYERDREEENC